MLSVLPRDVVRWLWMLMWLVGSGTALVHNHRAQAAESPEELADRAAQLADQGDNAGAIRVASEAIAANPGLASPYKTRGREYFRAGEIVKSVQDLDRYAELEPRFEPQQWERGIAYYYAGEFRKGAEQFERYQTYDGHDVENSVWRFLCMVPQTGVAAAQKEMLPIEGDRRVPMMKAYELYRGKCQPEEVLEAARGGDPDPSMLAGRLFYAHLYLGLWFDANGNRGEATRYIELAADKKLEYHPGINRYMWDVARIHQRKLKGTLPK